MSTNVEKINSFIYLVFIFRDNISIIRYVSRSKPLNLHKNKCSLTHHARIELYDTQFLLYFFKYVKYSCLAVTIV